MKSTLWQQRKKHQYGLIEGIKDGFSAYIKKTFFGKS